ncbi:gephyrin-like molybdotransferase Glp [Actinocorallia sp. A-T 12471]|uniref:molybdotransferase-like divisome protein Glp n=1 Tax=Actinocorallia sp. A-T 12471 TaxID=3089813 RepID=UPI0029D2C969|nr:gephyrin-like molybdotransferase Glp [Actinocorallia sp. A-T 12471]MDX6738436.1 molybdopterin molybdotransferase MoeA [Actinocorallia sp. A-T 12471]
MRSVSDHLAAIVARLTALPPLRLPLLEAAGTVLAEEVRSPVDLPPFDNSAMDGYAVRAADLAALPVTLPVVADIPAGSVATTGVTPGTAARIMTGAPLPEGADTVVQVEWTDGGVREVRIDRAPPLGTSIRRAGGDVRRGDVVLAEGVRLGAAQLGIAASAGRAELLVRPRPRVVVLSTGDELRVPGTPLEPGQIWDSNSFMLAAAVAEAGGVALRRSFVGDDPAKVRAVLDEQLEHADAVITTGGVSMGAYDVVKEVLSGGGEVEFSKVAMRPGKPQGFGLLGGRVPLFTLPGNPVSAYVSFQVFVRPALRYLQGLAPEGLPAVTAVTESALTSPAGLQHYLRASLTFEDGRYRVSPASAQDSHQMRALANSSGLIVLPADVTELPAGGEAEVLRLPS